MLWCLSANFSNDCTHLHGPIHPGLQEVHPLREPQFLRSQALAFAGCWGRWLLPGASWTWSHLGSVPLPMRYPWLLISAWYTGFCSQESWLRQSQIRCTHHLSSACKGSCKVEDCGRSNTNKCLLPALERVPLPCWYDIGFLSRRKECCPSRPRDHSNWIAFPKALASFADQDWD